MNRIWTHRDPDSHAVAPAALRTARTGGLPSHEVQALQARVEAYREARLQDRRELAAWRDGLRRLVQDVAPLALHNRVREQPDFLETAPPADWLALAGKSLAELRARARQAEQAQPAPAALPAATPDPQGWRRQPGSASVPNPEPKASGPGTDGPGAQTPRGPSAREPESPEAQPPKRPSAQEPGSPEAQPPDGPIAQGPDGPRDNAAPAVAAAPAADLPATDGSDLPAEGGIDLPGGSGSEPECPHQGTPWFRRWRGEGSLNDNLELLRARLRQWGVHGQPSVPASIEWRGSDTWIREMALLCLMAETGMAPTRQLALALARLAAVDDPFKKAGAQNLDLQSLASRQLIETTRLQVATAGKGANVTLNVAWLTAHGRDLITEHTTLRPVESEWRRLDRLHGGSHQLKHNGRVMLAASGFRTWGWEVAVLPAVEGAQPDLTVTAPGLDLPWPVEVEDVSGSGERRHAKWVAVAGLDPDDPRICLIAPDPHKLLKLAKEIRVSAPRARLLCADLRNAFRLPSSLAAARALPAPLLHLGPRDGLQPLKDLARAAHAAAAGNRDRANHPPRKTPMPKPKGGTP